MANEPVGRKEPKIYSAIVGVMNDIGAVSKDKTCKSNFGSYKFRGIDDVMNALHPAMVRNKVFALPEVLEMTRETKETREKVLELGVSQISGGSRTSVGGYVEEEPEEENSAQFDVSDNRTLDEVVGWLMEMGYVPSFCTACYREGRTGDRFMQLLKSGQIQNCCHPNALMTLNEYLDDYASDSVKALGKKMIEEELEKIPNEKVKETAKKYIHNIDEGQRDFRF